MRHWQQEIDKQGSKQWDGQGIPSPRTASPTLQSEFEEDGRATRRSVSTLDPNAITLALTSTPTPRSRAPTRRIRAAQPELRAERLRQTLVQRQQGQGVERPARLVERRGPHALAAQSRAEQRDERVQLVLKRALSQIHQQRYQGRQRQGTLARERGRFDPGGSMLCRDLQRAKERSPDTQPSARATNAGQFQRIKWRFPAVKGL